MRGKVRMDIKKAVAVTLALILAGCSSDQPGWMDGALNDVDQRAWMSASHEAKIATAGQWLEQWQAEGRVALDKPIEEMQPEAETLVECLDDKLTGSMNMPVDVVKRNALICAHQQDYRH
ncbi:hypothetical protein [Vreelandella populi]|uniref:Lipoprotein n=1 Tax=Vreelandella populi TaxID=2498858 RepID=A0A3S0X272_9GAMM|nr:hypothetical protein [Halomonas populi]RUR35241.1 hypothetical protein ELY25_14630 [Halomonas populi]RUR47432.1 hypothetical protein ELY37_03985 [Halomonas populi]